MIKPNEIAFPYFSITAMPGVLTWHPGRLAIVYYSDHILPVIAKYVDFTSFPYFISAFQNFTHTKPCSPIASKTD